MILTGDKIKEEVQSGKILIKPFNEDCVGPNSYDVHLGNVLGVYKQIYLDCKKDNEFEYIEIPEYGFVLKPGKLYLGSTVEYTETNGYVPMIEGKSSLGRLGLSIHITAGKGDIGFRGHWTLEMTTIHKLRIYPRMKIGQIFYHQATISERTIPYSLRAGSKYSNQSALPQPSKMHLNFVSDVQDTSPSI